MANGLGKMASLAKTASLAMAKGMETIQRTMATIPWKEFQNTMAKVAKVTAKTNIKTGGAGTRTHGCRQTVSNRMKSLMYFDTQQWVSMAHGSGTTCACWAPSLWTKKHAAKATEICKDARDAGRLTSSGM